MRNWNRKMIPSMLPLIPILFPIPPKYPKEPELRFLAIRIVPPLFQVAPAELENLLRTHQDVMDVAVIGVPDERKVASRGLPYMTTAKFSAFLTFPPPFVQIECTFVRKFGEAQHEARQKQNL